MHHSGAVNQVFWRTSDRVEDLVAAGYAPQVTFISPIMSTVLAAGAVLDERFRSIACTSACQSYADNTGLTEALAGNAPEGQPGGLHGATYSRLTRLALPHEVDGCNETIGDLFYSQLGGGANDWFVNAVVKVVGELHDNVPSHADGTGFSAAQVYKNGCTPRLEFAIADCGRGMLRNAKLVDKSIADHRDAILWGLKRGNTSARHPTDMAQRLPDEGFGLSPYPPNVDVITEENHHVGEGLWCLTELVRQAEGSLWIWSGNAQFSISSDGRDTCKTSETVWNGLAVELELNLDKAQSLKADDLPPHLIAIAERLGL